MNILKKTILLADDDAILRMILNKMLCNQGYVVVVAEDGTTAIQAFREADPTPDLIVTDYEMPGCNGLELAREIGAHCPVIMMSTDDLNTIACAEPNIDVFINKHRGADAILEEVNARLL